MINIKFNKNKMNKIYSTMLAGITSLTLVSCSKEEDIKSLKVKDNKAYTIEHNTEVPFLYEVTKYDAIKSKNQPYEMPNITKSYDVKCTPSEFKKYLNEENVTWNDIRTTINNSKFNDYHKTLLTEGVNNLEKHNFNMDLSVLNYNLKNVEVFKKNNTETEVLGTFDTFNHIIEVNENLTGDKYDIVFLHEMLGHGMTDAYIDDKKVYCSIDNPCYVIDEYDNHVGFTIYGNTFTEAMAQIIAVTALDKQPKEEYMSAYDIAMFELILLCKDNNIELHDYANYGVNKITNAMNNNNHIITYNLIAQINANHELSILKENPEISSGDMMYEYLCETIDESYNNGKNLNEINNHMIDLFNSYREYIYPLYNSNNDEILAFNSDFINVNALYDSLGQYAIDNNKTKVLK